MLGASTLAFTSTASATLIDSINLLNPGDKYRVLFVTSTTRDATSSDINVYNTFVQAAADAGSVTNPLGLTWNVLGSTESVNAQSNTSIFQSDTDAVTFFNTSGSIVAMSGSDLWSGSITAPILDSENGMSLFGAIVYTGTSHIGTTFSQNGLGSNFRFVRTGNSYVSVDEKWISGLNTSRERVHSFYGASQLSVIPSQQLPPPVSVPEPGSSLILLGLAGLLFSRYRKQS